MSAGPPRYVPSMAGNLLVASPSLVDPSFRRAVVLLLDHTSSGGAVGLVLNRPTEVDVGSVLPPWQGFVTAPGQLFRGGPVGLDEVLGLVSVPGTADDPRTGAEPLGFQRLVGSVGVVDLDAPPEVVAPGAAGLRIFAGHAGWSPGQLEDELDAGAWYVVDGEPADAFGGAPHGLWAEVLRRQRGALSMVATFPDDPSMN